MIKRILKYQFNLKNRRHEFSVPNKSTPIAFRNQRNLPTIWMEIEEVNTSIKIYDYCFIFLETGHDTVPDGFKYIGTELFDDDDYVLHCYYKMWTREFEKT